MPQPVPQDELHRRLAESHGALTEYAAHLRDALSPAQRGWTPLSGGWSVDQVFEHLCLATASYLEPMERVIRHAAPSARTEAATWRPTVMGQFLVWANQSPRRLPAPRVWVPAPRVRPEVIEAFLALQARLAALLDEAGALPWRRLRLRSPANRLIRLNLGDAFTILVAHTERHLKQADRITRVPGFPRFPGAASSLSG